MIYSLLLVSAWIGWIKIQKTNNQSKTGQVENELVKDAPFISVVIVVRNEAKNIINLLADLEGQVVSKKNFEVIIVDDHSTDRTVKLIEEYSTNLEVEILRLDGELTGKKAGVNLAVNKARGAWVLQTDGDCRVGINWVKTFQKRIEQEGQQCDFLSGPVTYFDRGNLFNALQQFEFLALIGIGGASIQMGFPNMANGANMAYRVSTFLDVEGYKNNEHIASGDDEFLLAKIARRNKESIRFIKDENAIVSTSAVLDFSAFISQRKRWAGKWKAHKVSTSVLIPIFLFLYYGLILGMSFSAGMGNIQTNWFVLGILLKTAAEVLFLQSVFTFFNQQRLLLLIPLIQVLYPLYTITVGLLSFQKTYEWKGRKLS